MSELEIGVYDVANSNATEDEAKEISKELFVALTKQKTCPAMAANQIGYDKRIIALVVREPIYLVNPKIVEESQPFAYMEAHSSFPNRLWMTMRNASIVVEADNLSKPIRFGLQVDEYKTLYKNGQVNMLTIQHPVVMEACYIQQTIDTLNGIHPEERKPKLAEPVKVEKTPGRNEVVTLIKDGKSQKIKYKRSKQLLDEGWVLKDYK